MNFLGKPIDQPVDKEWKLQAYIVQEARRAGYFITGSMEQGKRSKATAGIAKATGMTAGVPDVHLWLPEGRHAFVELKLVPGGKVSPAQRDFHAAVTKLGHVVYLLWASTPKEAWEKMMDIIQIASQPGMPTEQQVPEPQFPEPQVPRSMVFYEPR